MRRAARLVFGALLVTALSLAGLLFLVGLSDRLARKMETCRVTHVFDGDTVAMACKGTHTREVTARLAGLDAAEVHRPHCPAELAHGALARDRLRYLVASGEVRMRPLGRDALGRPLIRLTVEGRDVAETLIREGLAVAHDGGARTEWCRRLGSR